MLRCLLVRLIIGIAVFSVLCDFGAGDDASTPAALRKLGVESGDTFVFLGDSITYGCGWTHHVEGYFFTRFPQTRIRFVNAAVGGDRSWTVDERFDMSVAPLKPNFATIMLGMNDGRYRAYDPALQERYRESMTRILDRLKKMDTDVVLMTPGHFDRQTRDSVRVEPANNYNGVLLCYGNWLREVSWQRKLPCTDINAAMSGVLVRQRAEDPGFTLTTDGIHTNALGDFVMAESFLRELGMPATVSEIAITRDKADWAETHQGGSLNDLQAGDDSIRFTFHANALPWFVGEDAQAGYELVNAGNTLNQELLRVSGLPAGAYTLKIDGDAVATHPAHVWAKGVNLSDNPKTPQRQQSQEVAKLFRQRTTNPATIAMTSSTLAPSNPTQPSNQRRSC